MMQRIVLFLLASGSFILLGAAAVIWNWRAPSYEEQVEEASKKLYEGFWGPGTYERFGATEEHDVDRYLREKSKSDE